MRVFRWGKSLAIRLPTAVVEAHGLRAGDDIEIDVPGAQRLVSRGSACADDVMSRLHRFRGRLPVDFKFDREREGER